MAAGVYRVATTRPVDPGDLSIVGFDDGPLAARLLPSLTTIRLPIRELGRLAANKILHPEGRGRHPRHGHAARAAPRHPRLLPAPEPITACHKPLDPAGRRFMTPVSSPVRAG
jgi:hypothetical protein